MRYLLYFLISLGSISAFSLASSPVQPTTISKLAPDKAIDAATLDSIQAGLPIVFRFTELPEGTTPADIVRWLLNFLGSLLTTVIMYFLHKWWPKVFPSRKIKDYLSSPPGNNAQNK